MTPDQRQETFINSFLNVLDELTGPVNGKALANPRKVAQRIYEEMLAVQDHYEPDLANAIRHGLYKDTTGALWINDFDRSNQ